MENFWRDESIDLGTMNRDDEGTNVDMVQVIAR